MADDQGASPRELLIEACRRNNTDLLQETIHDLGKKAPKGVDPVDHIAEHINTTRDGVGSYLMHIAAYNGNYDALEELVDHEGVDVDPEDKLEGDTPLHKAVRYTNKGQEEWEDGYRLVELLLEAGSDPNIRNKAKLLPRDLVDPRNEELRRRLQQAEYLARAGGDFIVEDADDGPTGSGSDDD